MRQVFLPVRILFLFSLCLPRVVCLSRWQVFSATFNFTTFFDINGTGNRIGISAMVWTISLISPAIFIGSLLFRLQVAGFKPIKSLVASVIRLEPQLTVFRRTVRSSLSGEKRTFLHSSFFKDYRNALKEAFIRCIAISKNGYVWCKSSYKPYLLRGKRCAWRRNNVFDTGRCSNYIRISFNKVAVTLAVIVLFGSKQYKAAFMIYRFQESLYLAFILSLLRTLPPNPNFPNVCIGKLLPLNLS